MTLEEFVFDTPLYKKINHGNGYDDIIASLVKQDETIEIEGYNPIKKRDTTFYIHKGIGNLQRYSDYIRSEIGRVIEDGYVYSTQLLSEDGIRSLIIKCKRYGDTITIIVYHSYSCGFIMKIGQFPSVADIHRCQIKQYDKILETQAANDFTRAIGLAANGVGIGSFVYLRRIFENLVYEAYDEAKKEGKIDEAIFEHQRMDEKIKSLRGHLPSFIVDNHGIYGILSKGIHELSEEECLAYFDCMRKSIEMILDEKIEMKKKKEKRDAIAASIQKIASQIN